MDSKLFLFIYALSLALGAEGHDCFEPPQDVRRVSNIDCPNGYSGGSQCHITCEDGYKFSKSSTILTCDQSQGIWTPIHTDCEGIDNYCDDLDDPLNGRIKSISKRLPHARATFECYSGYELVGKTLLRCINTGKWNPDPPTCEEKNCEKTDCASSNIENCKSMNCAELTPESRCPSECLDGYETVGDFAVCQKGNWTNPPICSMKSCQTMPNCSTIDVLNCESLHCSDGVNPGSTCEVTCQDGFKIESESEFACSRGNWSGFPSCIDIEVLSKQGAITLPFLIAFSCFGGAIILGLIFGLCLHCKKRNSPTKGMLILDDDAVVPEDHIIVSMTPIETCPGEKIESGEEGTIPKAEIGEPKSLSTLPLAGEPLHHECLASESDVIPLEEAGIRDPISPPEEERIGGETVPQDEVGQVVISEEPAMVPSPVVPVGTGEREVPSDAVAAVGEFAPPEKVGVASPPNANAEVLVEGGE